ncbi:MAG: hypothetical protein FJY67_09550 [Calditrichaeota bacterium]|nr:hypothetical protein [Calditrichota bacterium]
MNRRTSHFFVALLFAVLVVPGLRADDFEVPGDFDTIQEAIEGVEDGDVILVADGRYRENIDFGGKSITLIGAAVWQGEGVTIIDGGEEGPCVRFISGETDAYLLGFTLENGAATGDGYGGGILIERSSPTIGRCIIRNSRATQGGGGISISFEEANPYIGHCSIYRNVATEGGGGGISIYQASARIVNCTIVGNEGQQGGGGLFAPFTEGVRIVNNIVAFNQGGGIAGWNTNNATVAYNDVFNNNGPDYGNIQPGEGSISSNPLFVGLDTADFHLTANSPCLDSGDPESPLDNDSSRADIGAYYFHQRDLISVREIEFGTRRFGQADCVYFQPRNLGGTPLEIYSIVMAGAEDFSSTLPLGEFEEPLVLDAGLGIHSYVHFDPLIESEGAVEATLTIVSNDIDEPERVIRITGSVEGDGVVERQPAPQSNGLLLACPNPFNDAVLLSFEIDRQSKVRLAVVDLSGREIAVLANGTYTPGLHSYHWTPSSASPGLYFARLRVGETESWARLVLLR